MNFTEYKRSVMACAKPAFYTGITEGEMMPDRGPRITLVIAGEIFPVRQFRVGIHLELGLMKRLYSESLGFNSSALRFLFDGQVINDEDTPNILELQDADLIEVELVMCTSYVNSNKT